jgi:hypothetical protein
VNRFGCEYIDRAVLQTGEGVLLDAIPIKIFYGGGF